MITQMQMGKIGLRDFFYCRKVPDSMTFSADAEMMTKRCDMVYRTAYCISIYDQQLGRRRGGKSRRDSRVEENVVALA